MTAALFYLAQHLASPATPDAFAADAADAPPSAFDGYERDSHSRPPPVGIPLGYVLEVITTRCGHCARDTISSRLHSVDRAGLGTRTLTLGAASPVFDRAIRRVNKLVGTPVCLACIEDFRPEPVHYPVPGAVLSAARDGRIGAAPATTAKRAVVAPTLADFDFS